MSEPYLRTYPDHPAENVDLANALRTALQGLPGITRAPIPPTLREPVYDFDVATICGPMVMSVRPFLLDEGVMFACQFQDPHRAAKHLGSTWGWHPLNPYSGKWNYNYDGGSMVVRLILRAFLLQLLPILPLDRLITHVYQTPDQSQIRAAFQGTEWTATIAGLGGPSFTHAAALFRLEHRPKDPLRFSKVTQDRAELARVLAGSLFLDMQRVLLREALQSLPSCLETP